MRAWTRSSNYAAGRRREGLLRDPATLAADERDALHRFFRERITEARDAQAAASWEAQLTQVFDYTAWHRFTVTVDLGEGTGPRQVTRKLHGTLSGVEKAIVLTSDHEWCTDAELDGIAIHQLLTDDVDKAVTTAWFIWTGTALEQADLPEHTATHGY